jgi:hypothetical protein
LWYVLKIRDPPEGIIKKIERVIYVFIWKGKREWLRRDSCRISSLNRGLGVRCPRAMRKMFLLQQLQKMITNETQPWMGFCLYWMGFSLRDINPDLRNKTHIHAEVIKSNRHRIMKSLLDEVRRNGHVEWTQSAKDITYDTIALTYNWKHKIVENSPDENWERMWEVLNIRQGSMFYTTNFKIVHNILPTNQNLYDWKIIRKNKCTYCEREPETIAHLFVECTCLVELRELVGIILQNETRTHIIMNKENIIGSQTCSYGRKIAAKAQHILNVYKLEIWKARNKQVFEGEPVHIDTVSNIIVQKVCYNK